VTPEKEKNKKSGGDERGHLEQDRNPIINLKTNKIQLTDRARDKKKWGKKKKSSRISLKGRRIKEGSVSGQP